jgi:hypothetical protein
VAALSGRHAAAGVAAFLATGGAAAAGAAAGGPATDRVPIRCEHPLGWIAPNVVAAGAGAPARGHFALRSRELLPRPALEIAQGGRPLWRGRVRRLMPGRSTRVPHEWAAAVDPDAGPVAVRLRG